jgi:hypothetical protein
VCFFARGFFEVSADFWEGVGVAEAAMEIS